MSNREFCRLSNIIREAPCKDLAAAFDACEDKGVLKGNEEYAEDDDEEQ